MINLFEDRLFTEGIFTFEADNAAIMMMNTPTAPTIRNAAVVLDGSRIATMGAALPAMRRLRCVT